MSPAATLIYTLSLHDALPISGQLDSPLFQLLVGNHLGDQAPVQGLGTTQAAVGQHQLGAAAQSHQAGDRKSTRLNSSHVAISYAVFCLKKKKQRKLHT